jgi:CsoR family transcriptional regulator, copper-sensing transcriptional repressor
MANPVTNFDHQEHRPMAPRTSHSYAENKVALLKRLSRMEGQVRGLRQMVEDDRYCLDIVQQITALSSAAREVALLLMEDHLRGCVETAITEHQGEAAIKEMITVLRKALRQ